MGRRSFSGAIIRTLFMGLFLLFIVCIVTSFLLPTDTCNCVDKDDSSKIIKTRNKYLPTSEHKLAILVPFRDRFDELLVFVPFMDAYLKQQNIDFDIFILNQVDHYRFNRASLINVGFLETKNDHDYVAMHDVDLLPMNPNLSYGYPEEGPFHVASPTLHPRYHYPTFVGGILLVNRDHYELVDGMSNKYWGWGLEDDEFYVRLKEAKLKVFRPKNITTDTTNTFKHIHDRLHRKRDTVKCYNQHEITRRRDRETGLHNVSYKKVSEHKLVIDDVSVTIVNIELLCDKNQTPWCDCSQANKNLKKPASGKS